MKSPLPLQLTVKKEKNSLAVCAIKATPKAIILRNMWKHTIAILSLAIKKLQSNPVMAGIPKAPKNVNWNQRTTTTVQMNLSILRRMMKEINPNVKETHHKKTKFHQPLHLFMIKLKWN